MARPTDISEARRDIEAAKLAEDGITWPIVTLRKQWGPYVPGTIFYGIPSSKDPERRGKHYLVNEHVCNCPDRKKARNVCKHIRAVRIHQENEAQRLGLATLAEIDVECAGIRADHDAVRAAFQRRRAS